MRHHTLRSPFRRAGILAYAASTVASCGSLLTVHMLGLLAGVGGTLHGKRNANDRESIASLDSACRAAAGARTSCRTFLLLRCSQSLSTSEGQRPWRPPCSRASASRPCAGRSRGFLGPALLGHQGQTLLTRVCWPPSRRARVRHVGQSGREREGVLFSPSTLIGTVCRWSRLPSSRPTSAACTNRRPTNKKKTR